MVDSAESDNNQWFDVGIGGKMQNSDNCGSQMRKSAASVGTSFGFFLPQNEACMRTVEECRCACCESAPFCERNK